MTQQTFMHSSLNAAMELAEHRHYLSQKVIQACRRDSIIETAAGLRACHSALKLAWDVYTLLKSNENDKLAETGFLYVLHAQRLPVEKEALLTLPLEMLKAPRIETFGHDADPIAEYHCAYKKWLEKTQPETRKILLAERLERNKRLTEIEKIHSPFTQEVITFLKQGNENLYAAAVCPIVVTAQRHLASLQNQR